MNDQIQRFLRSKIKSPYFFSNQKTQVSVDFRTCPFMVKHEGVYQSYVCKGCYSARIMNVYPELRKKMENLPDSKDCLRLAEFEEGCRLLKQKFNLNKIRFYSLSDFRPEDIPYIKIASKYFTVDIISKTLVMEQNRGSLMEMINHPNVWISLSFNINMAKKLLAIQDILIGTQAKNVNINYTLNYNDENPLQYHLRNISIFHLRNRNKRKAIEFGIPETRLCGVWGKDGKPVSGNGSCVKCNTCHLSMIDFMKGGKPKTPNKLAMID